MPSTLTESLGLRFRTAFLRDMQFLLALAAAPIPLLLMNWLIPAWSAGMHASATTIVLLVLWQPLVEELLFRGMVQGHLHHFQWARQRLLGLSAANYLTTALFVSAHLFQHSFVWALAVAVPSLVFGYFRDRHCQIYPALILHAAYNACYLFFGTLNNR